MDLIIHKKSLPRPLRGCQHSTTHQEEGRSIHGNYAEAPFVLGDIFQMRGWLEGLGIGYIEGSLSIVMHEGLWHVTGEVNTYGSRTYHNLKTILELMHRTLAGLMTRYPESHYRFTYSYTMEWEDLE